MIYILYFNNYPEDDVDIFFYYFGVSIGETITFFIPYIFKYQNNYTKNNNNKKCTKNNIIDYFFLILL